MFKRRLEMFVRKIIKDDNMAKSRDNQMLKPYHHDAIVYFAADSTSSYHILIDPRNWTL